MDSWRLFQQESSPTFPLAVPHSQIDPRLKVRNVGVHPGLIPLSASKTPAYSPSQDKSTVFPTSQRTSTVTLATIDSTLFVASTEHASCKALSLVHLFALVMLNDRDLGHAQFIGRRPSLPYLAPSGHITLGSVGGIPWWAWHTYGTHSVGIVHWFAKVKQSDVEIHCSLVVFLMDAKFRYA